MEADEAEICEFLKSWPGQFVSAREVCRRAGGKWRYREDENWALPVLQRMLEKKLVEADATGHYRLMTQRNKKNAKKWWISPEMKKALQESGKDFGVIDLEAEVDAADRTANSVLSFCCQPDNVEEQYPAGGVAVGTAVPVSSCNSA